MMQYMHPMQVAISIKILIKTDAPIFTVENVERSQLSAVKNYCRNLNAVTV